MLKIKKITNNILFIIFSILLVLNSGTVWQLKYNIINITFQLSLLLIIIINFSKIFTIRLKYLYIIAIIETIYLFIYPKCLLFFLSWDLIFLVAIILIQLSPKKIINYVYKFIYTLSLINLFIYILIVLGKLAPNEYMYLSELERESGKIYASYYNIFYDWQGIKNMGPISVIRNASIFVEPGRYGVFLNLALLYLIYYKEKYSLAELIVIMLNTIFTLSTTSILISFTILGIRIFMSKKKTYLYYTKVILGIVIVYMLFIIGNAILNDKISGSDSLSYHSRMYDIIISYNAFLNKPLFGYGIGNDTALSRSAFDAGNSNGLTKLLYQGGLVIGSIFITMFYLVFTCLNKRKGIVVSALTLGFILLQIMSQVMIYDPICLYFLFFISILNFETFSQSKNVIRR